jgi:hypothetical protein
VIAELFETPGLPAHREHDPQLDETLSAVAGSGLSCTDTVTDPQTDVIGIIYDRVGHFTAGCVQATDEDAVTVSRRLSAPGEMW